ncbi:MAG: TatD family hydrolase, partial [Candidatus Thiodiazotropha taylori]|nr:TatD family hydrolase [Candidatus Thiodiazotropha taylori]
RLNGLNQLAASIIGEGSTAVDLMNFLNRNLREVIAGRTTIWGPLQGDMQRLCHFAGWTVPHELQVFPEINSPAALMYWRIMVNLLDRLSEQDRREFINTYSFPRRSSHRHDPRVETANLGSSGAATQSRLVSLHKKTSTFTVTVRTESTPSQQEPSQVISEVTPLRGFDSHFHLDRTARKLLGTEDVTGITIQDIFGYPQPSPQVPVEVSGGVMVFCDPETKLAIPLMDGKWKIAVGVHPRKVRECSEGYISTIRTLLDSNPLVKALGEIGLDRTEPDYMWREQDHLFRRMLTLSRPDKVLVLHLRGSSDLHSSDVLMTALHLVRKACAPHQKVHLHCFTGCKEDVEEWLQEFPNCHFGFTARVSTFSGDQLEGLKSVPIDRILLETDSPYMPVSRELKANTPVYIGDVAQIVAKKRGILTEELLAATLQNGWQLYQ